MPTLTVKQVQSIIKNKKYVRHSDGNGLYLNIREPGGTASWNFRLHFSAKGIGWVLLSLFSQKM